MEKPAFPVPPLERQVRAGAVPTVWLYGRRYSNAYLLNHPELIRTTLSLRFSATDDLRRIECFTEDGQKLPPLELLAGSIARVPGSARGRRVRSRPRLGMTYSEDALAAYLKYLAARKATASRDST